MKNKSQFQSDWFCDTCDNKTTSDAVEKLVDYFTDKLIDAGDSVDKLETVLEKSATMLHPNHFVVNLTRLKLNGAYVSLACRMNEPEDIPVEVHLRRKELLDDVMKILDIVEPGLSRRRGE